MDRRGGLHLADLVYNCRRLTRFGTRVQRDLPQVAETALIKGTKLASGDDRLLMLGAELRRHRRD